ncbi:MAG: coproporphyrinogen dehydrogenase HemZ [Clostridiales bacterium GWF2_38_85]|nr:MAG: coproporphyrinogen dehydrogenase HemZ [Clostridiales bacterium GWF2_38_85]HBL83895.1 coproporphyrinogen dehydrogenase HemZ [Clostridiales bacterium]
MNLYIDNTTGLLNEYFFQMLCLIYFHGEKFPRNPVASENSVYFSLDKQNNSFVSEVTVETSGKKTIARAAVSSEDMLGEKSEPSVVATACGKAYLEACEKHFGFLPPWGLLTGIRPTKRALQYLENGFNEEQVTDIFSKDFFVQRNKSDMCITIIKKQHNILQSINENDCSLYIAIPFCPTRCQYCSFVSYSGPKLFALIPDYIEKLITDIKETAKLIEKCGLKLISVYIGGGTPTILTHEQIALITGCVAENFDMSHVREFTLEAGRPDTITSEKLIAAKSNGVTRVSINPQTLNENILKNMGRSHTVKQFFDAFEIARNLDFTVNTDLIAALPGDTVDGFINTLEQIIKLNPDNITVHTLSFKNAAILRADNYTSDPKGNLANRSVDYAAERLPGFGYSPYYLYRQKNTAGNAENCGYAKDGKESLYNILMMEDSNTVFGCGASAMTKIVQGTKIERFAFPKYPYEYLNPLQNSIFEDEILKLICKGN